MDLGGVTWIVAADAVEARVFAERVRSGPLRELPDLHMTATDEERGAGRGQRATVHARMGARRHAAGGRDPAHEAEARFLRRVANRLMISAGQGEFDRLVLMGPPHALGALRQALPHGLAARVDVTDAHARKHDDADALREHLREARARSWKSEQVTG
jgi:protein required for attachment to host cells